VRVRQLRVCQSVDLRDAEISEAQSVIGKPMNRRILTVVSARVDTNREAELVAGFRSLLVDSVPDGLLHTQLLKGANGGWQIQTLWRDRAARESIAFGIDPKISRLGICPARHRPAVCRRTTGLRDATDAVR
jgi:hypothetical protein